MSRGARPEWQKVREKTLHEIAEHRQKTGKVTGIVSLPPSAQPKVTKVHYQTNGRLLCTGLSHLFGESSPEKTNTTCKKCAALLERKHQEGSNDEIEAINFALKIKKMLEIYGMNDLAKLARTPAYRIEHYLGTSALTIIPRIARQKIEEAFTRYALEEQLMQLKRD